MSKFNTPSHGNMKADDPTPKSIQEIARDVVGKDRLKPPFTPISEKDAVSPLLQPDNDEVNGNISLEPASATKCESNWQEQIGAAKTTWSKLTEEELIKSEGNEHKLAGLVQGRYGISRDEANKQVKGFIEKYSL
jgi:uncharacterized protein YjbJ (UPF0337 family)